MQSTYPTESDGPGALPPTLAALRRRAASATSHDARSAILRDALVFARLTVQTDTAVAERDFAAWRAAGRPSDALPGRRQYITDCLQSLAAIYAVTGDPEWVSRTWELAEPGTWGPAERHVASTVFGFGIPKSTFALACAGIGYGACWDSRLGRKHHDYLAALGVRFRADGATIDWDKKQDRFWSLYDLAQSGRWPGDHAAGQWSEWLADIADEGRPTEHSVLLEE